MEDCTAILLSSVNATGKKKNVVSATTQANVSVTFLWWKANIFKIIQKAENRK